MARSIRFALAWVLVGLGAVSSGACGSSVDTAGSGGTTGSGGNTATGGIDYTLPAPVTFASGALNAATQTANLAIVNDASVEGSETAQLGLSIGTDNTGGQVTIAGGANSHTTTITDNDTPTIFAASAWVIS